MTTTYHVQCLSDDNTWITAAKTSSKEEAHDLCVVINFMGMQYRVIKSIDSGLPLVSDPSLN